MVLIYTSSWFTALPPTFQKIGISHSVPRRYPAGYRRLTELQPGPGFRTTSVVAFHQNYMAQLLALDPRKVLAKIQRLAGDAPAVALLCFENPHDPAAWCHRAHVSGWLHDTLGLAVPEFGLEAKGCGWKHPKLFREPIAPPQN